MRKRFLQTFILIMVSVAVAVCGGVQTAIAKEESRRLEEQMHAEQLAKEKAVAAWQDLDKNNPYLHMGTASSVEDIIIMGQLHEDGELIIEKEEGEAPEQPTVGAMYKAGRKPLICVDAGHLGYTAEGWRNTGSESLGGVIEHEWSLKVARVLRDELVDRGYDVYMVRDTDNWKEFPYDLGERTLFVNEMKCDAMVAIHWDGLDQHEVDGYHTIYKGNKQSDNYLLAKAVSDEYGKAVSGHISKYANPLSRDDLWQLNWARKKMASIIVECGFCTNPSDSRWLEDEDNFSTIAEGIANGIDKYFDLKSAQEDEG